jgi:hypothetical protein
MRVRVPPPSQIARLLCIVMACWLLPACVDHAPIEGTLCDQQQGCPLDDYLCIQGQCVKKGPATGVKCADPGDCPAGVCLVEAGVCVGCIEHTDCVSNLCERITHICKGCKADYQCPTGNCDEESGICLPESSTDSDLVGN